MEPKKIFVSLSARQGFQIPAQAFDPEKPALSRSFSGSFPIRAPLTLDSDSEFEHASSSSDSESESKVLVNGEELEMALERPFVADPNEDTVEESGFVEKIELARPFVAHPDEERLENGGVECELDDPNSNWVRPIAQLSWGDGENDLVDVEEEMVSEVEDGDFSSSIEFSEKVSIAPRVKVYGFEEDDDDDESVEWTESLVVNQSKLAIQGEIVEIPTLDCFVVAKNLVPAHSGSCGEKKLTVKDHSQSIVEDNIQDAAEDVMEKKLDFDGDVEHFCGEKLELEELVQEVIELNYIDAENQKIVNLGENDAFATTERETMVVAEEMDNGVERTIVETETSSVKSGSIEASKPSLVKSNVDVSEIDDNVLYVVEECLPCQNSEGSSVVISPVSTIEEGIDSEIMKHEIYPGMDLDPAVDTSVAVSLESIGDNFRGNQNEVDLKEFSESNLIWESVTLCNGGFPETQEVHRCRSTMHCDLISLESIIPSSFLDQQIGMEGKFEGYHDAVEEGRDGLLSYEVDEDFIYGSSETTGEIMENPNEEEKKKIEKMELLRTKFLRLVHGLGISFEDSTVTEVLERLILAAGKHSSHLGTLESAKRMALELDAEGKSDLGFGLNILVIGKTGVGKSATINSIFGELKAVVDHFEPATTAVKEIVGTINGVKIRILDTPGLKLHAIKQSANRKILAAIRKCIKKFPPDVVLYVDRLDTQTQDNDLQLLRSITRSLDSSIWRNAIITLTHAGSAPPDGPTGLPLSQEIFAAQKSHGVLQSINKAIGNLHLMNPSFIRPISLVENHQIHAKKNRNREPLPSEGSSGRSQLLLLCYSIKILSEASSITPKVSSDQIHPPSLPSQLFSLLQFDDQRDNDVYSGVEQPIRPILHSQFAIGQSSKMAIHVGLNKNRRGQVSVRTNSSNQLQIALAGVLTIVSIFRSISSKVGLQHST
ncbi:hypothetical protein UlMin_044665 [Ulmus minor]